MPFPSLIYFCYYEERHVPQDKVFATFVNAVVPTNDCQFRLNAQANIELIPISLLPVSCER